MSTTVPELNLKCKRCAHLLMPAALVCHACHTLVHAERLEQIAAEARRIEEGGRPRDAAPVWRSGLELLPPDSKQAQWIEAHAAELDAAPQTEEAGKDRGWLKRLGYLAPVVLVLIKSKSLLLALFKGKFFFSLFAFLWIYLKLYGFEFGLGFVALILVHEMGHYIDIRRRGLPADMPVFLPGLGAYVRWQGLGVSQETRAAISLAGPLGGLLASLFCAVMWWATDAHIWAALARSSAWLNILNLIPVWALDGGQAASAINKGQRVLLLCVAVALAMFFRESVFLLVAGGAVYRLFTKDVPPQPSRMATAYFVALLLGLAVIMSLVPREGFGS